MNQHQTYIYIYIYMEISIDRHSSGARRLSWWSFYFYLSTTPGDRHCAVGFPGKKGDDRSSLGRIPTLCIGRRWGISSRFFLDEKETQLTEFLFSFSVDNTFFLYFFSQFFFSEYMYIHIYIYLFFKKMHDWSATFSLASWIQRLHSQIDTDTTLDAQCAAACWIGKK